MLLNHSEPSHSTKVKLEIPQWKIGWVRKFVAHLKWENEHKYTLPPIIYPYTCMYIASHISHFSLSFEQMNKKKIFFVKGKFLFYKQEQFSKRWVRCDCKHKNRYTSLVIYQHNLLIFFLFLHNSKSVLCVSVGFDKKKNQFSHRGIKI